MQQRQVGTSDLRVSVVGVGCNNFGGRLDLRGTSAVVDKALDLGVTLFDTADLYGKDGASERLLGEALGARRKDAIIATKFGWALDDSGERQGASRRYIFAAVEASLKRLQTDWIDLYQLHKPDPSTPMEETMSALADLVKQGKIRYVGCSNLTPTEIEESYAYAAKIRFQGFISTQDHYNLLTRDVERELIPTIERLGISLLPYAPLAAGLLTGKFRKDAAPPEGARLTVNPHMAENYTNDKNWQIIEALSAFAVERGKSLLELAIAWTAAQPTVCSVIAGAMSAAQIEDNVRAAEWRLSPEDLAQIDKITSNG